MKVTGPGASVLESLVRLIKSRLDSHFRVTTVLVPAGRRGTPPDFECHSGNWDTWELKSASRELKLESHKLELVVFDWRGGRGCSRSRRTTSSRPSLLAGSDRGNSGSTGLGRWIFFPRTTGRPHLRSGCVEPAAIAAALCATPASFAGARSRAASRRTNHAPGRRGFRQRA